MLSPTADGFSLSCGDVSVAVACEHQQAEKSPHENIVRQLSKLGGTPFECSGVVLPDGFNWFIPSSLLAELRRRLVDALSSRPCVDKTSDKSETSGKPELPDKSETSQQSGISAPAYPHAYLYNIANRLAADFYGVHDVSAYELKGGNGPLMQCRHCLRYEMGHCVKHGGTKPAWREPLSLCLADGRMFRIEFDCKHCQMNVWKGEI
jgi:putative protease